jgi:hypothetical protein
MRLRYLSLYVTPAPELGRASLLAASLLSDSSEVHDVGVDIIVLVVDELSLTLLATRYNFYRMTGSDARQ